MLRKEYEASEVSDSNAVYKWLSKNGVRLLENISGSEALSTSWLIEIGVLNRKDVHIATNTVTHQYLGNNRDYGDGWHRGGAESFYKIVEIIYLSDAHEKRKLIAFKAIHSLGEINNKMLTEASWMTKVSKYGRCGQVYAVGSGTIIKEFLEEDDYNQTMTSAEHCVEVEEIFHLLYSLGLQPLGGSKIETIQHNNRLVLIDLGTGDISGPDANEFIQSLSKLR